MATSWDMYDAYKAVEDAASKEGSEGELYFSLYCVFMRIQQSVGEYFLNTFKYFVIL